MRRANTTVAKWGTSLAVRIPQTVLDQAQLKAGDQLEIEVQDRMLIIHPATDQPTLEQLVDAITPENCHPVTDWGEPTGKEAW